MAPELLRILGWACLLLAIHSGTGAEPAMRFAPLALENRETVIRQFSPLLAHLETQTGLPQQFVFHDSYAALLAAFAAGQIDLAYLGPLPYVRLRDSHPEAQPLVHFLDAEDSASYRCVIAAFKGDLIDLTGVQRLSVGLTQPLSTCGYLSTNGLLRRDTEVTLADTDYRYLGSHEKVALAILAGDVQIGGIKEAIAHKYAGLGLEILARTAPLPGFALVANRATVPPARLEALREILLKTPERVYASWGAPIRHGMAPAEDSDYADLRALDIDPIPALVEGL